MSTHTYAGRRRYTELLSSLDNLAEASGLINTDTRLAAELSIGNERRRGRRITDDVIGTITLVEHDGVLFWENFTSPVGERRRRSRAGGNVRSGSVVASYRFEKLGLNRISQALTDLDKRLTPAPGLKTVLVKEVSGGVDVGFGNPVVPRDGRVLLFIHGTFSETKAIFDQMKDTPDGRAFLAKASKDYAAILAYDHYTLSVSPLINAFTLQGHFAGSTADVDVIAHSRGGLVARWWLEGFGPARAAQARAVLVGSPLNGTSLASPAKLRSAMGLLTNFGNALSLAGSAAGAVPFLQVPLVLLKIMTSVTTTLAKLPLVDAAVAMVPGLACQSRVDNNAELIAIRGHAGALPTYSVVSSNYEPTAPGWKFWEYFREGRIKDAAADFVFQADNDLVVDTASMKEFSSSVLPAAVPEEAFGPNGDVHHVNYFRQPRTIRFFAQQLP